MGWKVVKTRKSSCVNARGIPPPCSDYSICCPTWVPPLAGSPPSRVPPSGYPPRQGTPLAGPGRVPPPARPGRVPPHVCHMACWEMLQSIMGYGYPPWTDRWKDRHVSKHYLPVVLRTREVNMRSYVLINNTCNRENTK